MIATLMNTGLAAKPNAGITVRSKRSIPRLRQVMRSTPNQGTYEGSSSPMGEDKQAKNNEAGAAPEGDRALEGEKVQLGGASAPGPTEYDQSNKVEGAKNTTPAGEDSVTKKENS